MYYFGVTLLSIVYMYIGFTGLLSKKMKLIYHFLLITHLIFIYTILGPLVKQFVTVPLVLISIIIIYLGCTRSILDIILSLTGYLVAVLANHLFTVPLTLIGIPFNDLQTTYVIPFLCAACLGTFALLFCIRKYFLRPKLKFLQGCPKKLLLGFLSQLLLCIGLNAVNFVYGDMVGYPTEVLTFNGIIATVFTLFTLMLFYLLYQLLQENYELKLQQKEQQILLDYAERMESFYDEFRTFRHDYKNILSTLDFYIRDRDFPQLQKYFETRILPFSESLTSDSHVIGKLHMIKIPSLKSILYSKLVIALNRGISPTLELEDPIEEIYMDEVNLARIMGILIDNAMEATLQTSDKTLSIAIVTMENSILFSLANSCPPLEVPISKLYEKGFSTKDNHDGLGLYTVRNITDSLENVSYTVNYDGLFHQILEIKRGD